MLNEPPLSETASARTGVGKASMVGICLSGYLCPVMLGMMLRARARAASMGVKQVPQPMDQPDHQRRSNSTTTMMTSRSPTEPPPM